MVTKPVQTKQPKKEKAKKEKSKVKKNPSKATTGGEAITSAAEFLRDARWANIFLPTITHTLYVSWEPFVHFTSESSIFLATVQNAFNLSFSNVDFTLKSDDLLVTTVRPVLSHIHHSFKGMVIYQAYKRLNSRKSKLAAEILKAVKKLFNEAEFCNQPTKIREYVCWALRGDGPAYYKLPTPQTCNITRGDPNYIVSHFTLQFPLSYQVW